MAAWCTAHGEESFLYARFEEQVDEERREAFRGLVRRRAAREPLVLQVLMGYSTKEIGEMMGLKQGAVLTRLHRARHKLMDSMADE